MNCERWQTITIYLNTDVREHLHQALTQRWSEKRGSIEWPPCSPDTN